MTLGNTFKSFLKKLLGEKLTWFVVIIFSCVIVWLGITVCSNDPNFWIKANTIAIMITGLLIFLYVYYTKRQSDYNRIQLEYNREQLEMARKQFDQIVGPNLVIEVNSLNVLPAKNNIIIDMRSLLVINVPTLHNLDARFCVVYTLHDRNNIGIENEFSRIWLLDDEEGYYDGKMAWYIGARQPSRGNFSVASFIIKQLNYTSLKDFVVDYVKHKQENNIKLELAIFSKFRVFGKQDTPYIDGPPRYFYLKFNIAPDAVDEYAHSTPGDWVWDPKMPPKPICEIAEKAFQNAISKANAQK